MASGIEQRTHLLRMQWERLCHYHQVMVSKGMEEPTIWLIDPADRFGYDMALKLNGGDVSKLEANQKLIGNDAHAGYLMGMTRKEALRVAEAMTETGHRILERPARVGAFYVVVVSAGGNTYAMIPIPR